MRDELKAVLDLASELDVADLPFFVGEIETIRCVAVARLTAPAAANPPDSLLTVEQLSARLNVSKDYIYRNKKRFQSFARPQGRKLLFSSTGLDTYLKKSR